MQLDLWHDAVMVPAGHHFEVWVQPADAPLWEPPAPAVAQVLPGSIVTLPLVGGRSLVTAAPPRSPATSTGLPGTATAAPMILTLVLLLCVGLAVTGYALLSPRR